MKKEESKRRKLTKKMKRKLAGVFGVTLLAFVSLLAGITVINAKEGNKYTQQVLSQSQQQYTNTTIPFRRGTITDRNGTVLANSEKSIQFNSGLSGCKLQRQLQGTYSSGFGRLFRY